MSKENLYKCRPILAKQILKLACLEKDYCSFLENADFILEDLGENYLDNAPICLKNAYIKYDKMGLINDSIDGNIAGENINVNGINPSSVSVSNTNYNLYNTYMGILSKPYAICPSVNSEYILKKLYERNIRIFVNNLVITIEGTIGCAPFKANYRYSGFIN